MTMRRIVVVGNGIAGLTACDSLRSAGFDGELTVVGAERHHPYSRPALSKALLHGVNGTVSRDGIDGNSDDGLQAHELPEPTHEATELLGVSVSGLDVDARVVRLDGGGELPYDGLVIASGSRAKRLAPTEGAREPRDDGFARELTLRTIEDAITLKQRVASRPSVIVVGGGPLGMEVASGCLQAGCEVTLVSDAQPLSRQLGDHLSGIFTTAAARRGLRVVGGGKARLIDSGAGTRVALADGTRTGGRPRRHRHRRRAKHRLAGRLQTPGRRVAAGGHPRPAPAGDRCRRRRGVLPDEPRGATRAPVDQRHRPGQGRGRRPAPRRRGPRAQLPAVFLDGGLRSVTQVGRLHSRGRRTRLLRAGQRPGVACSCAGRTGTAPEPPRRSTTGSPSRNCADWPTSALGRSARQRP